VVDAAASTIDCFLWRDTFVSSTQLNRPIRRKQSVFLHMKHLSFRKYSFQKLTHFSQANNMVDSPASNTDC
jgi:hypothetical protein